MQQQAFATSTYERSTYASGAWPTVCLLALIAIVSWLDRLILTLLVTPIQNDLGLTDAHFGVLLGIGFVVVFVTAGLPIASALDRVNRKWVLVAAVILWCLSTVAAGFAQSFAMLLVMRAGVAFGEAALMPAAVSMISDHFPPEQRRKPTSLLMAVNILGATGAYVIGGLVVAYFNRVGTWGGLSSWRLSLIAVGLMGLPAIALFALFAREPARSDSTIGGASFVETLSHLRTRAPLYLCVFAGAGLLLMMAQGSAAWLSTLLVRGYGFEPAKTGPLMALTFAPTSILGVSLLPALVGPRTGRTLVLRIIRLLLLVCALSTPFIFVAGAGNLAALLATGALAMLGQGSVVALVAMLIQSIAPGAMRARITAVYYMLMNLIAAGVAPVAVASAAANLFRGPHALGAGLAVTSAVGVVAAAFFFLVAYRWSRRHAFVPG